MNYIKSRGKEENATTTLTNVQVLNLIQGFCKGKCFLTKNDLNTIVAVLTSSQMVPPTETTTAKMENNNKSESSIVDLMNNFISNNYLNQKLIDINNKQSIKGNQPPIPYP